MSLGALAMAAVLMSPLPPVKPEPGPMPPPKPDFAATPGPGPAKGSLCSDPRLAGERLDAIVEVKSHACGVHRPVRVHAIDGIVLAAPVVADCPTAQRLADWLTGTVRPHARELLGSRLTSVWVMGSYQCRGRNRQAGAKRSEHALGRAVDVGGFTLADGRTVTLEEGWDGAAEGRFLRTIWQKACGPFATVLGPDADEHHRDHLHLDTSRRGGDAYCR